MLVVLWVVDSMHCVLEPVTRSESRLGPGMKETTLGNRYGKIPVSTGSSVSISSMCWR